ncbi:hypothetical protein PLEOSDRAFT_1067296 [Pleurotus ostreatus PC15]|uniref:Sodium/calcium exchanger membrane region domain-containing protein n=1 Tax=Pleurotus ostreatus (strain PC15) TaxID=1137138 RepID=A0A067NLJ1_PLEO1|nr:hypothetical protein PLEOSDRAFT_1067296 [Pleurotus ostreatus PC15]
MTVHRSVPRLLFVTCFVVNCILWSQSRYGRFHDLHSSELLDSSTISLVRRGHGSLEGLLGHKAECHPLTFPVHEQCKHVHKSCPTSDTFLSLDYLSFYFCLSPALRPLGFVGLILWLAFLFSALGISASDFFIPNLSTIAQLLGLDENVAGVTFLAFGNGSPDVFSTFAAMRTNSGSLAIGELIGAASFIVSVVVGSMCIIKPFQVNRGPFLRDVGFFAAAVALLLVILLDNELLFVEAAGLVVLYVFYALVVVSSSWWERRQEGKRVLEARIRAEYDENTPPFMPYRDNRDIFAAPAVMMLTLTLPVVVMKYEYAHNSPRHVPEGRLVDFEEEGVERVLVAEEEAKDELHDMDYNKWLTAVQCVAGPIFAVSVLFNASSHLKWILLATSLAGVTIAILVVVFGGKGNHTSTRTARCFMGFFVAIVWIMAVADETVNILRTFGFIFGLSDAIIGLTIFAVGNSLADLVANMSVATFAPIMGFSACFGGPMLNILLGVGISGSYITHQTGVPYELHFSTTLLVSTVGLLSLLAATVIFVPWNGYFLTRSWGVFLIVSYCIIMTTNIVVELNSHH